MKGSELDPLLFVKKAKWSPLLSDCCVFKLCVINFTRDNPNFSQNSIDKIFNKFFLSEGEAETALLEKLSGFQTLRFASSSTVSLLIWKVIAEIPS